MDKYASGFKFEYFLGDKNYSSRGENRKEISPNAHVSVRRRRRSRCWVTLGLSQKKGKEEKCSLWQMPKKERVLLLLQRPSLRKKGGKLQLFGKREAKGECNVVEERPSNEWMMTFGIVLFLFGHFPSDLRTIFSFVSNLG